MLFTLAIVMIVLWLLGLLSSFTMGGFIHALLVVAVILLLVRLISGRKALST
jgi:multisubunit Na+/H+ antiporter MnhE subunit